MGPAFFFFGVQARLDLSTFSRKPRLPTAFTNLSKICAISGPDLKNSTMSSAKRRSTKLSRASPGSKPAFPSSVFHCRKIASRTALGSRGLEISLTDVLPSSLRGHRQLQPSNSNPVKSSQRKACRRAGAEKNNIFIYTKKCTIYWHYFLPLRDSTCLETAQ